MPTSGQTGALIGEVAAQCAAQAAAFLALLLAASAVHKWTRWRQSARAVHEFAGVPRFASSAALGAVGLAELAAATLLAGAHRTGGALLAALIFAVYLALILRALATGRRDVDCGCSFGGSPHPLGAFEAWRNAVLLLLAAGVAGAGDTGRGMPLGFELLAAAALLALYGALDQVMTHAPRRAVSP